MHWLFEGWRHRFFSSFCSDPLLNLPLLPLKSIKKENRTQASFFVFTTNKISALIKRNI